MDSDDLIRRQNTADRILKDELWNEAWEKFRASVFSAIENAKSDEATIRGKLMLGIANDVRHFFETVIKTGQYESIQLEQKKRLWPF